MSMPLGNSPHVELSSLRKPSRSNFEIVLLIIIIAIFFWFLLKPKMAELKTRRETVTALTKEEESYKRDKTKLDRLARDLRARSRDLALLDEALPLDNRITRVEYLVDSLAKSSGLSVVSLTVDMPTTAAIAGNKRLLADPFSTQRELKKASVAISVNGAFDQFQDFIDKVQNNARIMDISELSMVPSQDGVLEYRLLLTTYYFAAP